MINEFEAAKPLPTRQNLKALYPQSPRFILMRCFWALLAFAVAGAGYVHSFSDPAPVGPGGHSADLIADQVFLYIFYLTGLFLLLKLLYETLYFVLYTYDIELEHLTIVKGVFFRSRAAFPIAKVNDVSLMRNFIEMIWGLYSLNVLTASPVAEYGAIAGLSKTSAVGLQTHLLSLVETTLPDVKERAAESVVAGVYDTHAEMDRALHGNSAQRSHEAPLQKNAENP